MVDVNTAAEVEEKEEVRTAAEKEEARIAKAKEEARIAADVDQCVIEEARITDAGRHLICFFQYVFTDICQCELIQFEFVTLPGSSMVDVTTAADVEASSASVRASTSCTVNDAGRHLICFLQYLFTDIC